MWKTESRWHNHIQCRRYYDVHRSLRKGKQNGSSLHLICWSSRHRCTGDGIYEQGDLERDNTTCCGQPCGMFFAAGYKGSQPTDHMNTGSGPKLHRKWFRDDYRMSQISFHLARKMFIPYSWLEFCEIMHSEEFCHYVSTCSHSVCTVILVFLHSSTKVGGARLTFPVKNKQRIALLTIENIMWRVSYVIKNLELKFYSSFYWIIF